MLLLTDQRKWIGINWSFDVLIAEFVFTLILKKIIKTLTVELLLFAVGQLNKNL